jgi:hypothetical protein
MECVAKVGGNKVADGHKQHWNTGMAAGLGAMFGWYRLSPDERVAQRATRAPSWGLPTKNTLDRATSTLPKLLYERLDEIGFGRDSAVPQSGPGRRRRL